LRRRTLLVVLVELAMVAEAEVVGVAPMSRLAP
jgi:hypothetical protein